MDKFSKNLMMESIGGEAYSCKSFLIYADSGCRKTWVTGSLLFNTIHANFDNGANSAVACAELLELDSVHKQVRIKNLNQLDEFINTMLTNKAYRDYFDNIVIDNLVEIGAQIMSTVSKLPRFRDDQLCIEDVTKEDPDKRADSKKIQALYKEAQELLRDYMKKVLMLRDHYNVIVLSNWAEMPVAKALDTGAYPQVLGPASVKPLIMLFDEVYTTEYEDEEFDSKGKINTKFKINTHNHSVTNKRWFGKTRNIKTMKYLLSNEIPADFREVFKETGYVYKRDRKGK